MKKAGVVLLSLLLWWLFIERDKIMKNSWAKVILTRIIWLNVGIVVIGLTIVIITFGSLFRVF